MIKVLIKIVIIPPALCVGAMIYIMSYGVSCIEWAYDDENEIGMDVRKDIVHTIKEMFR